MSNGTGAGRPAGVPLAVGVRKRYDEVPDRVRAWVEETLGAPVVRVEEQVGGMSPGCASRVVAADGRRAFVKAVGPELNPLTPSMFRNEATVLAHLGSGPLWADLVAVLDEPDGWVALLLEDVPGRHPEPSHPEDAALLLDGTDRLATELAGRGEGVDIGCYARLLDRFDEAWDALGEIPDVLLPRWAEDAAGAVRERHGALREAAVGDCLVHIDLLNDNMLVRPDGSLVFVDWAMARRGADWVDPLVLRLEWAEQSAFDDLVRSSAPLRRLGEELVSTYLFSMGVWLAYRNTMAEDVGLPTLAAFRRRESERFLIGARRRMGL